MPGPEAQHSARGFYPREGRYAIGIDVEAWRQKVVEPSWRRLEVEIVPKWAPEKYN